jgi:hypothetical protein
MSENRKWFSNNSDALCFIVLLAVLVYSCDIMLFNPCTSYDSGCGALWYGLVDGTADSTAECTADCVFVLVSDLFGAQKIYYRVHTGSLLARSRCGVISSCAAASLMVVCLCVVVQQAHILNVEVDQADQPAQLPPARPPTSPGACRQISRTRRYSSLPLSPSPLPVRNCAIAS